MCACPAQLQPHDPLKNVCPEPPRKALDLDAYYGSEQDVDEYRGMAPDGQP